MMKVYVELNEPEITRMFMKKGWDIALSPKSADLICFSGGADVSPMLYEQERMPLTMNNLRRDQDCANLFYKYELKKPFVGICRGAQFLNVMNGGSMYQDVDNHTRTHEAYDTSDGRIYNVTSTHHQMMIPHDAGEVVMVAEMSTTRVPFAGDMAPEKDIEVVYYGETNSLCFQPHPEYTTPEDDTQRVFWEYLDQFIL